MTDTPMTDARITDEMLDYFEGQAKHVISILDEPVFVEVDPLNLQAMIREIREGRAVASRPATSPETPLHCPTCELPQGMRRCLVTDPGHVTAQFGHEVEDCQYCSDPFHSRAKR